MQCKCGKEFKLVAMSVMNEYADVEGILLKCSCGEEYWIDEVIDYDMERYQDIKGIYNKIREEYQSDVSKIYALYKITKGEDKWICNVANVEELS